MAHLDLCGKRPGVSGWKEVDPRVLAFSRRPIQQQKAGRALMLSYSWVFVCFKLSPFFTCPHKIAH